MKIKVALSKYWQNETGKIPLERTDIWREFNGSFENKDIDVDLFPLAVQHGLCYTAQHKQYRKKENFISSQFLALDFDKGKCDFDSLLENPFIQNHSYFLHTTPSHTKEKPRTRVVFVLDKVVEDKQLYAQMTTAIVDYFELSDDNCKEVSRFFYGSKDCDVFVNNKLLSIETFNELILIPYQKKQKRLEKEKQKRLEQMKKAKPLNVPDRLLHVHREKLLEHIRNAPNGEKHHTILKICTTFGGYISSGYYSYSDIFTLCKDAILSNPHNVKDFNHAFATIEKSLDYGMQSPLYFEDRYSSRLAQLPDVHKVEMQKLIWEVYHDGMNDRHLNLWQGLGFTEEIVNHYSFGYCKKKVDEDTGETFENAFTIPFRDSDENVLNVEYRFENRFYYENDLPFLFETDHNRNDYQMVVLPDSLIALNSYLYLGDCEYNFVGLPHMNIVKDTIDYDGAIVLLESDTKNRNFQSVKDHCRFVRLTHSLDNIVKSIDLTDFKWLLQQGVKW